jgi:hypothetical protein
MRKKELTRLAFSIGEMAAMIGSSANFVRLELQRDKLKSVRRGHGRGRVFIPAAEVERYLKASD